MNIPIERLLKTKRQLDLAKLQDSVVGALYEIDPGLIMHGGTAIWRCYNGNRFSDDVDLYATDKQIEKLNTELAWALSKQNVKMDYPKVTRIIEVFNDSAKTKLEAMKTPKQINPVQMEYSRLDGTKLIITTLSKDDFIIEKVDTYQRRRYARDLYDIYHLTSTGKLNEKSKKALALLLKNIESPINEPSLKGLIYSGSTPTFDTMVNLIQKRLE